MAIELFPQTKQMGQGESVLSIAQTLFCAEVNGHILHLQAKNKSYATHMALGEFYEAMGDLRDAVVEKYQGKYGILTGYKNIEVNELYDPIYMVKEYLTTIEIARKGITDGYLQQLTDNIIEQFASTLYKLTNLK